MKRLVLVLGLTLGACSVVSSDAAQQQVQDAVELRLGESMLLAPEGGARAVAHSVLQDGHLTADEAVRLSLANNPGLRAVLAELEIARAELWGAVLPPNPIVDAEVEFLEAGGGEVLELSVAQSVIDALLIPRRRQVAAEQFEAERARVTSAVLDLAVQVRISYRRLQAQLELVALFRSATDATYFSFDAARRLRDAGNINELEFLREQELYEDAKLALVDAQVMAEKQREGLNALLGIWGAEGGAWEIEPRLPFPPQLSFDPNGLESAVLASSLDLEAKRHEIIALGHALGLERLEVMFAEGAVGVTAGREADGTWGVGPLVSFSVPVFNFGQAANAGARARLEQAYAEYTDLAIRLRRSTRSAYIESEAARESSRYFLEVVLPLRANITEQTQRQFNAMQLGVFQLLASRRSELDAGRRYVEALLAHWTARAQLESLLLGRLPMERFGIANFGGSGLPGMEGGDSPGGH